MTLMVPSTGETEQHHTLGLHIEISDWLTEKSLGAELGLLEYY